MTPNDRTPNLNNFSYDTSTTFNYNTDDHINPDDMSDYIGDTFDKDDLELLINDQTSINGELNLVIDYILNIDNPDLDVISNMLIGINHIQEIRNDNLYDAFEWMTKHRRIL